MTKCFDMIFSYLLMLIRKINADDSSYFLNLGHFYYKGFSFDYNLFDTNKIQENDLLYLKEYVIEANYLKAKKYYEISSTYDNPVSLLYLGKGVDQDYLQAKKYFELSAKLNNPDEIYSLGVIYEYGYGVKQDYLKAKECYESLIEMNHSDALLNLGNLYFYGNSVKKDYKKARMLFEKSAEF